MTNMMNMMNMMKLIWFDEYDEYDEIALVWVGFNFDLMQPKLTKPDLTPPDPKILRDPQLSLNVDYTKPKLTPNLN